MEIKEYSFLNLLSNIVDNRGKTCPTTDAGMPLIATNCIKNDQLYPTFEKIRFVSDSTYDNWFRGHPEPNDIIFVCKGSPGRVAWTPDPVPFCIAQDMVAIRANESIVDAKFLFALLRSNETQQKILNMHVGSLIPHFKKGDFKNLYLSIPVNKAIQIKIGEIYFNISKKIEINSQINQTLEAMAQALFKSWFVDFEPVKAKMAAKAAGADAEGMTLAAMEALSGQNAEALAKMAQIEPDRYAELKATAELFPDALVDSELGEIPVGWRASTLSNIIEFNPQRTLKKGQIAPYLDMKNVPTSGSSVDEIIDREMQSGTKFINGDTLLARITPCLENGKTAFVDFLEKGQVGWGSTEFIVMRPVEPYPVSLGYFIARLNTFRQAAIQSMTGTSGRQRANAKALADLPWVIYPLDLANKFDTFASKFLLQAKNNHTQNKYLAELRDTLLPKLLSGEVSVADV